MPRRRQLWQSFFPVLVIIVLSLCVIVWLISNSMRQFYSREVAKFLEARAQLLSQQIVPIMVRNDNTLLDSYLKQTVRSALVETTVFGVDGKVLADSIGKPSDFSSHFQDLELRNALAGSAVALERYSEIGSGKVLSFTFPLRGSKGIIGALRQTRSLVPIDYLLNKLYWKTFIWLSCLTVVTLGVKYLLNNRIRIPLDEIVDTAEHFARGDLAPRIPIASYPKELRQLGDVLNRMAAQLAERIKSMLRQHNEHLAVLSSMTEGVIALDLFEHVISINSAAARLLAVSVEETEGRSIYEVVRNYQLKRIIKTIIESDEPVETDLVLHDRAERYLQINGTVLRNASSEKIGILIVLNDVTRLKRLEQMRRDFVANVSHELRTPITSIKGFVETLLDGSAHRTEDVERFHRIVLKQVHSLHSIVEDLLQLSRLEQAGESGALQTEENELREVLADALEVCELKASEKLIKLELQCPETLRAKINRTLIEQAVVNLVDNAINYSDPETVITAEVVQHNGSVVIKVRDQGWGIDRHHLSRVFERFYRVDKGRDRKLGGTGLGLAIVKHIALAHRGIVNVESSPGEGSTFSITLPG